MQKEKLHETLSIELTHDPQNGQALFEIVKDEKSILLSENELNHIIDFLKETNFILN